MANLHVLWSTDSPGYLPRRVVAHAIGYPAKCWDPDDPEGEHGATAAIQYVNTVFDTEEEAVENARRNLNAGLRMAARRVQDTRQQLAERINEAAAAAEESAALLEYIERREREVSGG